MSSQTAIVVEIIKHVSSYAGPGGDYLENSATLEPSTYSVKASDDIAAQAKSVIEKGWHGGPHATLVFLPQNLQPVEGSLQGTFRLTVPEELKRLVWNGRSNQYVAYETETGIGNPVLVVKPQFEDETLQLRVDNRFDQPGLFRRIPLKDLFLSRKEALNSAAISEQEEAEIDNKSGDTIVEISSVELPVYEQVAFYPSDWYLLSAYVDIEPVGLSLYDPNRGSSMFFLPLDLKIAPPTSHMSGTKLTFGREELMSVTDDYRKLDLVVTRSSLVKTFVYGVAFMPLVLLFLLAHMLLFASRNADNGVFVRDLILAVAGVVIAILPLRAVLVPQRCKACRR